MEPTVGNPTNRKDFLKGVAAGAILASCCGVLSGCGSSLSERLSVEPRRVRGDEPFAVRLRGLAAGERVVLTAAFEDSFRQEWSSTAVFEADGDGAVDTHRQAPVEGSYGAEDPMGLVWSALGPNLYTPPLPASPVRLRGADRPHEDALVVYPGAGHALGAPHVPTGDSTSRFGGTAEANARANEDSWKKATTLLDRALRGRGAGV